MHLISFDHKLWICVDHITLVNYYLMIIYVKLYKISESLDV